MKHLLLTIAVIAFLLRLGYAAGTGALRHPQTWEEEAIATNLIRHNVFLFTSAIGSNRAYAEPLYPFMAAGVYFVTGHSQTALVLLQLLIASATVWMVGWAAELATGTAAAAIVAATLAAIHPGLIQYSSVLHPFVLDAFAFIAAAAMLVRYRQSPTLGRGAAAAAIIGAGALTRPTILVLLLPLCWIRPRRALVLVPIALALVAPWTIRNAVVLHHFILTRSGTGFVLWLGNNPNTTGSATDVHGQPLIKTLPPGVLRNLSALDEVQRDRYFRSAAWAFIRSDPAAAVRRVIQRVYYFWWFSPQWGFGYRYPPLLKMAYRLWWGLLLVSIAIGAATTRHRDVRLMAACAVLISMLQCLYYVEGRHRLAVEPLLLPLAAVGLIRVFGKFIEQDGLREDAAARGRRPYTPC